MSNPNFDAHHLAATMNKSKNNSDLPEAPSNIIFLFFFKQWKSHEQIQCLQRKINALEGKASADRTAHLEEVNTLKNKVSAHLEEIKTLKVKATAHLEEVNTLKDKAAADRAGFQQEVEALRDKAATDRAALQEEVEPLKDRAAADRAALQQEAEALKDKASTDRAALQQEVDAVRNQLAKVQADTVAKVRVSPIVKL